MWMYERRLEYPIKIKNPNPALAKFIISQYGGPHGEIGASLRYLSQRCSMPYRQVAGILNDIGTEAPEMFLSGANAFFDAFATV
jgi:spore coat protein JC